jgi:uncharacterized protein YfdQ (DUF2303 family)
MPESTPSEAGTLLQASPAGDAATIVEAATRAAEPTKLDGTELYSVVPAGGGQAQILDLERFLHWPRSVRGTYKPATVESFSNYVKRHQDVDHTTIWVHPTIGHVEAVLNDSANDDPNWGDHRAVLDLIVTDEWKFWTGRDGQLTGQEEFAEHVEDGVRQIVEPEAATMLEIAQSIHATTNASFRSATRLADGEIQVAYDEEIQASAGHKGELSIPREFILAIAPFVGEEPYRLTARLRYRVGGGNLRIGYKLDQPDEVVRDALKRIADGLAEEFVRVYMGTPAPSARG